MADKDQPVRRLQWLSARKSAPVSAGGVNTCRLALYQQASKEEEEEEPKNECENIFCRQILANRYARFCEDKPMCQRYRALKLQCLANAQAEENEENTRPLLLVIKRKTGSDEEEKEAKEKKEKKKKKKKDGTFMISRKKTSSTVGKKRLELNLNSSVANLQRNSNLNASGPKENVLREKKKIQADKNLYEEKKKEKRQMSKRVKRVYKEAAERTGTESPVFSNLSSGQGPSASSLNEFALPTEKQKPSTLSLARQSTEASDATTRSGNYTPRTKRRRVSVDNILAFSASSYPTGTASVTSAANPTWRIGGASPNQARTSAQAIRKTMNVDLVPLGVANQTNFAGGGRYVQNGNRSAMQSLKPSDSRPRPPSMTKFRVPAISAPSSVLMAKKSPRPAQRAQPTAAPQAQRLLPPLPPQASALTPPVPRPTARAVTPSALPVEPPAIKYIPNPPATTVVPEITRISATDYLMSRRNDSGRKQPGRQTDRRPSRSSSIERSGSLSDDHASGALHAYPRSDSAPVPSYTESRSAVDPHSQNHEGVGKYQRLYFGIEESRMKLRERSEICGEFERFNSRQRDVSNFSPSRDRYPHRYQRLSPTSISNSENGYAVDTHFNSASSSVKHFHWSGPFYKELPSSQHVPSHRRSEQHVNNEVIGSGHDALDEDAPTFSHYEEFLPQLLSVFTRKLPQSLEAVFNVTKKPRKMSWYITYVERIEHLCKAFDLHVKFNGLKAVVTVRGREWLTLRGTSTLSLHVDVIRSLRAEAVTWLRLKEEMETAFAYYKGLYGSQVNESLSFLRAWNELKHTGNYISLPRETNYFFGSRLHHWNFVVGKVEIGSGSHEEKREAFRLATVSALNFLLSIGRGARRPAVKRERVLKEVRHTKGRHRSPSRESYDSSRTHSSPGTEIENGLSPELPAGLSSPTEPPQPSFIERSTEQLPMTAEASSKQSAASGPDNGEPDSSAATSTSSITVGREKAAVVHSSHELVQTVERSGPYDEMSIRGTLHSTSLSTERATMPAESIAPTALLETTSGVSAAAKDTPNEVLPPRRCMMCEMIRMRKPDGERCLRCQQNDTLANGVVAPRRINYIV